MNNYKEDFDTVKKLSELCDNCKFAACEQCEINYTQIQALKVILNNYEALQDMYNTASKELEITNKILNRMAEDLTTPIHSKEWILNYYKNEVK